MASSTSLIFDIFAKDHNTKQTFEGIEKGAKGLGSTLGSALGPLGLGLGFGLGAAGIAEGIGKVVKAAGDFEAANTRLVTSAGESEANLKMVGDGILKVAQDTGTATEELEKGAYYIESAGFHGADMLNVLKAAAQGAKAEGSSVQTVGDAVTSALRDYHLTADQAANVTSKMITAVGDGKTTFELFTGSLHSVLPIASAAHISMDDILGDLASMTVHGMSADQATQNLNHTIMKLINPTQQQTSEFALLGTTAQEVQRKLGTDGLSGTLDFLQGKIAAAMPPGSDQVILSMKTAIGELDPKVQAFAQHLTDGSMGWKDWIKQAIEMDPVQEKQLRQLDTLLGQTHRLGTEQKSGADVLQTYDQAWRLVTGDQTGAATAIMLTGENAEYTHKAVKDVSIAAADAAGNVKGWAEVQDTFNNKLDRAKEVFETTAIKIGTKLLPALGDAIGKFTEFVTDVAPQLSGLWEKDIQPALDNISKSLLGVFGNSAGDATGDAANGFGTAMDKVGTNADGTMGKDGTVARAAKQFGQSMQEMADSIKTVTDALPQLDKAVNDVNQNTDQFGIDAHNAIVNYESEWQLGLARVILNIESFRWNLIGAFADADTWLINAGENLVLGLINGMTHLIPDLVGKAVDLGAQAVKAINDALGNHSPSVKAFASGVNFAQGLVNGLDSMHGPSRDAMGRLGWAAASGFDMTPAMAGGGAAFGGGSSFPSSLRLVVDGHEFTAYVDSRASNAIDNASYRAGQRPSR